MYFITHLHFRHLQNRTMRHKIYPINASIYHINPHDQAEQTDGAAENFHDQNLDEERRVRGIGQSRTRSHNTDGDAAEKIDKTNSHACTEHQVPGHPVLALNAVARFRDSIVEVLKAEIRKLQCHFRVRYLQISRQDNSGDQTVNGDGFAKNYGNQVLGFDAWSLDAASNDADARRVDTPATNIFGTAEIDVFGFTYTAAPTTERATERPIPIVAHMCGDVSSKNLKFSFKKGYMYRRLVLF